MGLCYLSKIECYLNSCVLFLGYSNYLVYLIEYNIVRYFYYLIDVLSKTIEFKELEKI